ncbi:uncharacterized protein LOC131073111 isoform X2 [Cryptomeria japonica]|uniref:uncharacterized protein LOC131073111 isoform X2 n=1 Tax=Cryptomeria japonica TaxID=3369 RepID=UPI0027D9D688|nr:uncharacterized protein LOC131073111 isoform X2 [Cryptomeria japonica]
MIMEGKDSKAIAIEEDCIVKKPSKAEEALEIQALRRIISSYLNYSDAAEDDVKKWEKSYAKLLPQHKALVTHLPKKYQKLRRCIATNSFFILNMLQAFEPPFDMNQYVYAEIHTNYQCSHGIVPQSAGGQQILPESNQIEDTMEQKFTFVEPFPTNVGTHRMLNTIPQEESSGNAKSNETTASEVNISCERNLCQVQSFSTDRDSESSMQYDVKLNADFGEGNKNTSVPIHNHDSIGIDRDQVPYTTSESMMLDRIVSGGFCGSESNISGNRTGETFNQQSTCCSGPASNGEVRIGNCTIFDWRDPAFQLHVSPADVDKVRCILRNIVRDWAPEGAIERRQCFQPILDELQRHFPNRSRDRPPSCLVPGAGLARLALEISLLGFVSQGNEFSYYMMICSSFILNHCQAAMEWVIHPWIHSNCNSLSDEDQIRPVYFPDIHPGSAGIMEGFSMCAGDFVEVYGDPSQSGTWDAVVTCFFIDTAHNVIEYIEIISNILKDGGVWINLGPLLYHFADVYAPEDEMSIELSLEDVKRIAFHYGFELETEKTIETTYTANFRSMMQNRYFAAFWTMIKRGSSAKCVTAKAT